jgi:hypothetical protein
MPLMPPHGTVRALAVTHLRSPRSPKNLRNLHTSAHGVSRAAGISIKLLASAYLGTLVLHPNAFVAVSTILATHAGLDRTYRLPRRYLVKTRLSLP